MKFLCPSCKAKYQIADEKVAGRSVRMKCRKCGYVIHVSKAVTEPPPSDGSDRASSDWPSAAAPEARSSAPPPDAAPEPSPPPKPAAPEPKGGKLASRKATLQGTPPPPRAIGGAKTAAIPTKSAPQPAPKSSPLASKSAPLASKSSPQAAPKPVAVPKVTGQSAAQAAALAAKPAPAVRAAPPAPRTAPVRAAPARPAPAAGKRTLQDVGPQPAVASSMFSKAAAAPAPAAFDDEDKTRIVDGSSALAGALSSALSADQPPSSALAGAFSDAVGESASDLGDLGAPADEWYVGINGVPVGPIRLSELRSKASAGAVNYDSLVWRDGFEQWQPLRTFPELLAIVEESLSSARASLTPQIPAAIGDGVISVNMPDSIPMTVVSAGGNGAAIAPVTGPAVVTESPEALEDMLGVRRRGSSAAAWIAVVVALLFGLTAGFVLFSSKKPPEPIVKYVEVPAKAPSTETPVPPPPSAEALPEATVPGGKQVAGRPQSGTTAKNPEEKPSAALPGLKGLEGLKGLGPAGGGPAGDAPSTANQPLDGASVQRTVSRYTSSVKRSCWQPALDTRTKDAPTSARVNVTITVSPSGSVQNVTTSGEPRGYRGLAGCIASRVRGWQFPPSNGTTTVNVPFVFAAQ